MMLGPVLGALAGPGATGRASHGLDKIPLRLSGLGLLDLGGQVLSEKGPIGEMGVPDCTTQNRASSDDSRHLHCLESFLLFVSDK